MTFFLLACLVLTAYRVTRLIVKDTLPPVLWARDRLVGGWRPLTDAEQRHVQRADHDPEFLVRQHNGRTLRWVHRASWVPDWLAELLSCPWCASAYVSGVLVLVTDLTLGLPAPWLVGPAVWGASALLAAQDWA